MRLRPDSRGFRRSPSKASGRSQAGSSGKHARRSTRHQAPCRGPRTPPPEMMVSHGDPHPHCTTRLAGLPQICKAGRGLASLLAALLASPVVAALWASSALASATSISSVQETLNVGVRSLTVGPSSVGMCSGASPLTFPTGHCDSPQITITNGPVGGHIAVNGTSAVPSDKNGNDWTLCGGTGGAACSATDQFGQTVPGPDQYNEWDWAPNGAPHYVQVLSTSPQCDGAFDTPVTTNEFVGCRASPGQAADETLHLIGPTQSEDQSPTFCTSVVWTAVP